MALETVYATDEDLRIHAPGDYWAIVPREQKILYGTTGVINNWTLTTAEDAAAQGLAAGMVVSLLSGTTATARPNDQLAVQSVATNTVTLRRIGFAASVGEPPTAGNNTVYVCYSAYPQLEEASYDLNERLGLQEDVSGREPTDLHDLRQLRRACVFSVLSCLYWAQARQSADRMADDFAAKAKRADEILGQILARLALRWTAAVDAEGYATTSLRVGRFSR